MATTWSAGLGGEHMAYCQNPFWISTVDTSVGWMPRLPLAVGLGIVKALTHYTCALVSLSSARIPLYRVSLACCILLDTIEGTLHCDT